MAKSADDRFWAKVLFRKDEHSCWEWTGGKLINGYGWFKAKGKSGSLHYLAHRFSWELHNGPIPAGMFVCHHCDNPPCVRPDHLFLGNTRDNAQDAKSKGRLATGIRHGRSTHPEVRLLGLKNPNAKLDPQKVVIIRQYLAEGTLLRREIAAIFGVARATINRVAWGQHWTQGYRRGANGR